jgi:lipoprotein-anchoring transpeptidase ErfK/SrfK
MHGTAEPSRVGKTEAHGCVRLTNRDVGRLAALVKKGIPVDFVEPLQAERRRAGTGVAAR